MASWWRRIFGARPDAGVREDMPRLGSGGPPVGKVYEPTSEELAEDRRGGRWGSRRSQQRKRVDALALDASNVSRVISIFDDADRGYVGQQQDLIEDCRRRDPRLNSICVTRVLGAQSRQQVIQPPPGYEGNAAAQRTAEYVRRALATIPRLRVARGHLASASIGGLGLVELDWHVNADGVRVPHPRFVHPNRTGWDISTERLHKCEPGLQQLSEYALEDYVDKFAIHVPVLGMSTYPWRRGAMTPGLVILSMTKRMGIRWLMQLMERWGQPQVFATLESGAGSPTLVAEILEAFKDLSTEWQAVFPKGATVGKVEGSGDVSPDLHAKFLEIVNAEEAIALLGQNWTTEAPPAGGGSYAAVVAADRIRQDLLLADIQEGDETFTEQIIEPIIRYNRPGEVVPIAVSQIVGKRPIAAGEYQTGAFTADELRESMGYSPWGGEEGARKYPLAAAGSATNPGGGLVPDITSEPDVDLDVPAGAEAVADLALNGAQVTSLLEIVAQVANGQLPRATGIALISLAFPSLSQEQVERMMGTVGAGFTPAPEPGAAPSETPAQPPGGAAAEDPFEQSRTTLRTSSPSTHPLASVLLKP